jgi:hypothetical protein
MVKNSVGFQKKSEERKFHAEIKIYNVQVVCHSIFENVTNLSRLVKADSADKRAALTFWIEATLQESCEPEPHKRWPKATQGGPSGLSHSDQKVLVIDR